MYKDKISIVIPCYRSAGYLERTVNEILSVVENHYDFEIVLVNDGSPDNTANVITKLCEANTKIKGVLLSKNFGQANATMAGFSKASGNLIVCCDDDGQSPIRELKKLIDEIDKGYDVVFAKYRVRTAGVKSKIGSYVNNQMLYFLLGKPKDLAMGNFWATRRYVVQQLLDCKNPYPFIAGLLLKVTNQMSNVEMDQLKRHEGKSTYSLLKLFGLWLNGFTAFSVIPLRAASLIGLTTFIISILMVLQIIYTRLTNPGIPIGYSSVITSVLGMGGLIMLTLGLIGEYVGRIYLNINAVPQFVVKKEIGF